MKKFFINSRKGSALLIGLIITVFLSIFITSFLEKALSIGKSVKSVEQSIQAYYIATSNIEKVLNNNSDLRKKPWNIKGIDEQKSYTGSKLTVYTGSNEIPKPKNGNSKYDSNWNIISIDKPVQIVLNKDSWKNGSTKIKFKPHTGSIDAAKTSTGIIYFSMGDSKNTFYLSGAAVIGGADLNNNPINLFDKAGFYYNALNGEIKTGYFSSFLDNNVDLCGNSTSSDSFNCTIKFSMINPIYTDKSTSPIPFLEYKIEDINGNIPLQFMTIKSQGFVGKILRQRDVQIPQITTNTALDFAVLQ